MTEQESKKLITETFENDFDEERFKRFIANLLTEFQGVSKHTDNQYVKDAYKQYIESYDVIGKFSDSQKKTVDVLIVYLKTESTFTARTRQRNFALDYLKSKAKDGVLIAYVHKNKKDWRFSFVKLESDVIRDEEGRVRDVSIFTAAKRSSFLVGSNENSYTAKKQLLPILQKEEKPTFEDIEEAFGVETVTKEFFNKYRELFHKVHEALEKEIKKKPHIKEEFETKEISTVDFAKKLLGQMVFLYFLQKKGWFGVAPKEEWGTGPKNFLRKLFERKDNYGENFFNDVLKPLFYQALAQDRGRDAIYPRLNNCRMPFLNGGLFEPMRGYSWETTDILLPDELFSNEDKEGEDVGTGILDVFDRYNFTVNESDPLEKEVAVDPEMLGKVFENLLDVKDRKSKGSYYTPREVVHYMCQECLINYLKTETKGEIPRDDIENLLLHGESIIQNDFVTLEKQREKEEKGYKYSGEYKLKLPESIRKNARKIDDLLKDVKVCDPAVGSGAFPLGMINEIVGARRVLQVYLRDRLTIYDLKYHAIANSIHGVDLDPGAVDIARLRLWLSLVVEEENPRPLPNLEHRIMQGNSLISEYEGIPLFNRELLSEFNKEKFVQLGFIFGSGIKKKMEELERSIKMYVGTSQRSVKESLGDRIDELRWELIEETLKEQNKLEKVDEIRELREKSIRPFFIWELEFSEVFMKKGGFDIVIGNPPYVGEKGNKETFREIKQGNMKEYYQGKMDLFYFFFHLALDIGHEGAENAYITTNYYPTALGGKNLRTDLKERAKVRNLINFNELKIFESAKGQHNMITIFSKGRDDSQIAHNAITNRKGFADSDILNLIISGQDSQTDYYSVKQEDLYDGVGNYIRFEGVSIDNKYSLIDSILNNVKDSGVLLNTFCDINNGVHTQADYLSKKKFPLRDDKDANVGDGIYVLNEENSTDILWLERIKKNKKESNYLKPFFKNSDIAKYYSSLISAKSLIYINKQKDNISELPNIQKHLNRFTSIIKKSSDNAPYLHRPKNIVWSNPKIVCPQRSKENTFGYNEIPWYAASDVFFITSKVGSQISLKYILALLNSRLYYHWLYHRGKRKGENLELIATPLSEIPIKVISKEEQQPFIDIVNQILKITSEEEYDPSNPPIEQKELEKKIDEMVYDLYNLSEKEREYINLMDKNKNSY